MNRRHFFALSLPALLGGTASAASAQAKPALRRVKIEVSLLGSSLKLGSINAHIISVVAEEDAETSAVFLQMYTFKENAAAGTVSSQAFGPALHVTPHLEAGGKITLTGKVQFEEAVSSAAPNEPLPLNSNSLAFTRTVTSGQATTLGGLIMGEVQRQVEVTATLLAPHQTAGEAPR